MGKKKPQVSTMATRNEIIATELATDPLGRGYSGMSDEAAAADANTKYRILERGVFLSDSYQYLSHRNEKPADSPSNTAWPCLVMLDELAESGTVQGEPRTTDDQIAAKNLMGFFAKANDAGGGLIYMDFNKAAIRLSWDAMRDAGVISPEQRTELETLSNVPQSRANELTGDRWTTQDVTDNR